MTRNRTIFLVLFAFLGGCVSSIDVSDGAQVPPVDDGPELNYITASESEEDLPAPEEPTDPEEPEEPTDPAPPDGTDDSDDNADEPQDPNVPEPGTESCVQWQECGPHYGDANSLYQCINNTCMCDPNGGGQNSCQQAGGYFVGQECYCAMADNAPPADPVSNYQEYDGQECWYHWEDVPCDPDVWVDTSYYTEECYYNSNNELICETVYVNDGYWEEGYCPPGWWEVWCY